MSKSKLTQSLINLLPIIVISIVLIVVTWYIDKQMGLMMNSINELPQKISVVNDSVTTCSDKTLHMISKLGENTNFLFQTYMAPPDDDDNPNTPHSVELMEEEQLGVCDEMSTSRVYNPNDSHIKNIETLKEVLSESPQPQPQPQPHAITMDLSKDSNNL